MKKFTCSFRDQHGKEYSFDLWALDWADAEVRLSRLKFNATLDGEVVMEGSSPGFLPRWLKRRAEL